MQPLIKFFGRFVFTPEDAGEIMAYYFLQPQFKNGWFLVNEKGEALKPLSKHTDELRELVWKHTIELTNPL
jgi:hypothetical protein